MSIYTKTGDRGTTKVFDKKSGQLVDISKDSCTIVAIGAIDELNSFLGMISSHLDHSNDRSEIKNIQGIQANLFVINSILAGSQLRFSKSKTKKLEKQIDKWEGGLPVQKNFIFYGGTPIASQLFYARAICRRAERALVAQSAEYKVPSGIMMYINRLSDYLFMMARNENFKTRIQEKFWKSSK